ncbi:transaldolase family protein [Caenibacillus caldisaponilyticus]|uniref:transaldolase family protein n=1 Tax=Caenibacillus caldisaponilyticus TaxID=1674942 RepID=UPI00098834E0|nr:transaldolase family protein [Caenibacillus caldisaponilyticus]
MKLYIDSANVEKITRINEYYPLAGVTTNPTILATEGRPYLETLKNIQSIIGMDKELFVQVLGDKAEEMVDEGKYIVDAISGKVVVKVPVTEEGLKAIRMLSAENIPVLATTIYTGMQALLAAMSGAKYVAPYVNRIDNLPGDGLRVVSNIVHMFLQYDLGCEVLAASFKNVQQVYDAALAGAQAVTVSPDIIEKFVAFPSTKVDVSEFRQKWTAAFGKDHSNLG